MFNPHIHQQQQQQFHQQLRQLQQLFQQQQPPPPPPQPPPGHHVAHHHHQTPRAIPVPTQTAPPPRMVNLSHASQTTIIAPNPMLQGALLMQQMQGNMRGFGMGGQQFRQFFTTGNRSSLLGPVPMGMAIKSPIMGFPAARPFHPHPRYFNNTATSTASSASSSTDAATRQVDRKRDSEQMAAGSSDDQPAAASSTDGANGKTQADGAVGGVDGPTQISEEQLEEPAVKKKRTEGSEKPPEQGVVEAVTTANTDEEALSSACSNNTEDIQPEECIALEEGGSRTGSDIEALEEIKVGEVQSCLSAPSPSGRPSEGDQQANLPAEDTSQSKDVPEALPENQDEEEGVAEGSNKFYCYLCSITCHNQQNFRSHMNSMSHQQRMMEIQHMSNACLVTLLPRVQESLQGANKDGEKKADLKRWCATCLTHFTSSIADHRRTEEHRLASKTDMSSCAICKKHFKNSQMFLEHLQSQEHRQKLQEKDCEAFAKLTSVDTEGFSLEAEEGTEEEEGGIEGLRNQGDGQDGWSSVEEMTLNDMASDEQYDPDTVYGSSFLVPVAGFICRLCNKFYNFESSALHTHCKSLQHFENLKRYSMLMSRKGEKVESSGEAVQAADDLMHVKETTSDCSDKNLLSDDTGLATNRKSLQPVVTLTQLKMQTRRPQKEKLAEPEATSEDLSTVSATSSSNTDTSLVELTASSSVEADSEPSASGENAIEEVDEKEAPVTQGKKNGTGKAKTTARRRSGRATNRR